MEHSRRRGRRACGPATWLAGAAATVLLLAQTPARAPGFPGRYALVPDAGDDIGRAIEEATAEMNFLTRGIARGRLRKTNVPYRTVDIAWRGDSIAMAYDGGAPIVTPASGEPIHWTREDGERLRVSTVLAGDTLRQTFVAEDGRRENVYTLDADGATLTMHVTVTSGRLPAPVAYALVYRREAGDGS